MAKNAFFRLRSPFRTGDYVVGDDPFNGRIEGVVAVINGKDIGVRPAGGPSDHFIYFDYRTVKKPD